MTLAQLHFTLSKYTSWNSQLGQFDLAKFFWNVVEVIESEIEFKTEILDWWNMYVTLT